MRHKLVTFTLLFIFLICSGTLSLAKTLFSDDFSKGADRWEVGAGKWEVKNGEYVQSTTDIFLSSFVKATHWDPKWAQYTLGTESDDIRWEGRMGFCFWYRCR